MKWYKQKILLHKDICLIIGLFLIAILIWVIVFATIFNGLWITDSFWYGSVARNIYEGKGFTTNTLDVAHIQFIEENIKASGFSIMKGVPLYPLFISGLFHIFSVSDRVVGLSSGIFFILTIPFLFLLAKSLFGSTVAIISSLIYIFDTHLLFTYSICGLTEPMFIFFLVLFFFVLYKSKNYKYFLLAGGVLGLANLTRPDPFFYFIPVAVYLFLSSKDDRIKNMVSFLFGYILVMSPYFIFCHLKFGNPFIIFSRGYEMLPAAEYSSLVNNAFSDNSSSLISTLAGSFLGILKKMYVNLSGYYHRFFQIANPYILAFFVVSIFRSYKNKYLGNFNILFLVMFAVQILVSSAAVPTPKSFGQFRHLFIFYPIMIIFASSLIVSIFESLRRSSKLRYVFVFLLFLLIFLPTITNFYHTFRSNLKTSHHNFKEISEMVRSNTSPDDIIATDIPYELSWYSKNRFIHVPMLTQKLVNIDNKVPINSMLITSSIIDKLKYSNNPELTKEWDAFIKGFPESFLGFELKEKMKQDVKIIAALYKKQQ